MQTAVSGSPPPPDTSAPSAPSGLTASTAIGSATLGWTASTDNVAVARYNVHRSQTSGFTPAVANRIAQPTGTGYTDSGLAAGTYFYRVTPEDAAGNISGASSQVTAVVPADQPPGVLVTAPASGATVSSTISVNASASDDVGVAGVQFRLGAVNLGSEDTTAPYSISWDTTDRHQRQLLDSPPLLATPPPTQPTSTPITATSNSTSPLGLGSSLPTDSTRPRARAPPTRRGRGTWARSPVARRSRSLRVSAQLRRRERLGDGGGRELARSDDRDDAGRLWVRPSALSGWRTVAFKERSGGVVYSMAGAQAGGLPVGQVFIGSERSCDRDVIVAAECLVVPRDDLRRVFPEALRERDVGSFHCCDGCDGRVDGSVAPWRQQCLGGVVRGVDRRGPGVRPSAVRGPRCSRTWRRP